MDIAANVKGTEWQRLSAGNGAKGPRLYDWARIELERLTWLGGEEPRWAHWPSVRRSIEKPEELAC